MCFLRILLIKGIGLKDENSKVRTPELELSVEEYNFSKSESPCSEILEKGRKTSDLLSIPLYCLSRPSALSP